MSDKETIETYGTRIIGERTAIPRMLALFKTYGIHATWAGVGMLMARNKDELYTFLPPPERRPLYTSMRASSYNYLREAPIGNSEEDDQYHFGESFVHMILNTPHQEFGNHTFSHYYCIDGMHNEPAIFAHDLDAFNAIAKTYTISATSIIFLEIKQVMKRSTPVQKKVSPHTAGLNHTCCMNRDRIQHKHHSFARFVSSTTTST